MENIKLEMADHSVDTLRAALDNAGLQADANRLRGMEITGYDIAEVVLETIENMPQYKHGVVAEWRDIAIDQLRRALASRTRPSMAA